MTMASIYLSRTRTRTGQVLVKTRSDSIVPQNLRLQTPTTRPFDIIKRQKSTFASQSKTNTAQKPFVKYPPKKMTPPPPQIFQKLSVRSRIHYDLSFRSYVNNKLQFRKLI
jgi:CCR4-NOT transcriptional regulation complex NOT5 subunit